MKFDVTKLPLGSALVGFVFTAVAVTFVLAFVIGTRDGGIEGGEAAEEAVAELSPNPDAGSSAEDTPIEAHSAGGLIVMGDNFFEFEGERAPAIPVAPGEQVTFDVTNDGMTVHNIHIAGADNEYGDVICTADSEEPCSDPDLLQSAGTGTITFQFDQAGEFVFRCDFHPEMVGTIVVG